MKTRACDWPSFFEFRLLCANHVLRDDGSFNNAADYPV